MEELGSFTGTQRKKCRIMTNKLNNHTKEYPAISQKMIITLGLVIPDTKILHTNLCSFYSKALFEIPSNRVKYNFKNFVLMIRVQKYSQTA